MASKGHVSVEPPRGTKFQEMKKVPMKTYGQTVGMVQAEVKSPVTLSTSAKREAVDDAEVQPRKLLRQ